ncbi:MAG: Phospho-N-acetylmuramoyl-pentapeptide-transferase, partial [Chlamydiae bacterium]|nr:Phospho-N-acetylmuramoyl-pentapeptide-transferase [Chlamydiota bacterium]
MLLIFLHFLKNTFGIKIPSVFEYYSTRMTLAAITALLVTVFFGKPFIKKLYEWKIGDRVRSEDCPLLGELHHNKNDTPTMGGVLILFSLLVSLFLWMDLRSSFTLLLFFTTISVGALGAYDDYLKLRHSNTKGISTKKKFLIQAAISFLIVLYLLWPVATEALHFNGWFSPPLAKEEMSLHILTVKEYTSLLFVPFFKEPLLHLHGFALIGMGLLIIFVITGTSNAVNLSDGLDGLASGMVLLAAAAFALIAFISNNVDLARYLHILYIEGSGEIAIYLSAVAGACLGFLWYNGYPAQVFMGDTGSLTLGAILGVSVVLLKREILLVVIGGLFVVEALSVILQVGSYRLRNKKRLFLCAPLHHHY